MKITYDKSLKALFLSSQRLSTDQNGYLLDDVSGEKILDENSMPIKAKQFAGFRKGSRIFLSRDIETIVREAKIEQKHGKKA